MNSRSSSAPVAGRWCGMVAVLALLVASIGCDQKARERAVSTSCLGRMKMIALSARLYAHDHGGVYPPDFATMKTNFATPVVLICPAKPRRGSVRTWDDFDFSQVTYEYVTTGLTESTPDLHLKILFRCPFHGHEATGDGAVHRAH